MLYKRSRYNITIENFEDGKKLVYNTYSGACGIMDLETQAIYNQIEKINPLQINDATMQQNVKKMIQFGYIVDEQLDELAAVKMERLNARVKGHNLTLTIAPTMACNMRCPYCYENKTGKTMSLEVQEKLVEFVKAHLARFSELKRMSVIWYGGEPLLQKNIIYTLSKAFIELCHRHDIAYDASIITNGSLLDKSTAKMLRGECSVQRAQITIDGMPSIHNKRRVLVDGSDSFDLIVRNIEDSRQFMNISIRMNVDKTNEMEVQEFLQFALKEMKWDENPRIYLAPVDCYTESCAHTHTTCFARSEFAKIKSQFQRINYDIDRDRVKNEFFPRRIPIHCSAERNNSYVIDPEGNFYNCWMVIGDRRYSTGHIDKPFIYTHEYYRWLSGELPQKCEQCEYLPLCAGGCGYFRIIQDGQPNCAATFYSYKDTLKLAYYDYIKQKTMNSTSE